MSTYEQLIPVYSTDQPEVHFIVQKMRKLLDEFEDRMMIGEIYLPIHKLVAYYGTAESKGAHLPFNFLLLSLPWDARQVSAVVDEYEGSLPSEGWPNWVLGNHDQPRITSRVGLNQARVAGMLLLTLRGTPTIYYGDEIGMTDVPIPFSEVIDPQGLNMPDKNLSRDPARTPMQWENKENAGFTQGKPWLRIDKKYPRLNVASEKDNPYSMLSFYKKLIDTRTKEPSLAVGRYQPVAGDPQVMAYVREESGHKKFLVVLNFSHRPAYFTPKAEYKGKIIVATLTEMEGSAIERTIILGGDEAILVELE